MEPDLSNRGSAVAAPASPRRSVPRILAVSSGGGHWVELRRLRPAWEGCDVIYLTTEPGFRDELAGETPVPRFFTVPDGNRWSSKLQLARMAARIGALVLWLRPDVVISTGALPGYVAIRAARLIGARGIWVDSIANVEELSMSGRKIGPHCDLWLTQWEHLSRAGGAPGAGPDYAGKVI